SFSSFPAPANQPFWPQTCCFSPKTNPDLAWGLTVWDRTTGLRSSMQTNSRKLKRAAAKGQAAMTLVEVLIAMAISGLAMGAIVGGYYFASVSAEKSGLLLAGTAKAMERLEEARAAKWDI